MTTTFRDFATFQGKPGTDSEWLSANQEKQSKQTEQGNMKNRLIIAAIAATLGVSSRVGA
jgi:hypothetical protein